MGTMSDEGLEPGCRIDIRIPASHATDLQLSALARHWQLNVAASASAPLASPRVDFGERLYRTLDGALFRSSERTGGSINGAPSAMSQFDLLPKLALVVDEDSARAEQALGKPAVWVTYDGLAAHRLDEAVRRRVGQPGGTTEAVVWAMVDGEPRPVFQGACALEHRSAQRSLQWVSAKLPGLLRAGYKRAVMGMSLPSVPSEASQVPIPPSTLVQRLMGSAFTRLVERDQWYIAWQRGDRRRLFKPPPSAFWADPFIHKWQGRTWLLFEELPFATGRGHISAIELDDDGQVRSPAKPVLQEPWHLSYPFLVEDEGALFMVPESSAHRTVDLYVCDGAMDRWRHHAVLLEGSRWADATLARFDGRWWMFASHADPGACLVDELHVFWADRIEGPWHPHRLNPVKVDARCARPAGAMWVHEGSLYRPVQDCSSVYGGSVRVLRVLELDENRFAEAEVACDALPPQPAGTRMHTFNRCDGATVVDLLQVVGRFAAR